MHLNVTVDRVERIATKVNDERLKIKIGCC